jgi:predicted metalloenzyme YecM
VIGDPVGDIIGDYRGFVAQQHARLLARGIDIAPYELSHLAVRVPEWDQYVHLRTLLERHAVANRESVWNGRPISLIVLAELLRVLDGQVIPLIELIPPVHQRVYKMGLEHFGVSSARRSTPSPGSTALRSPASSSRARRTSRITSCSRTSPT